MSLRFNQLLLLALLLLGGFLRSNQFGFQVLLDDEWHAVHQILSGKSAGELFLTLGLADYSVPLGLFYGWIAQHWGLSEFIMRLPMLLASLLTLVLFSAYVWRHFTAPLALMFSLLLALSPLLVVYAHTARPYALTLLLSFVSLYSFYQYWHRRTSLLRSGAAYVVCAGLCLWLHLITGPVLVAPFVLEGVRCLWQRNMAGLQRLLLLGVPAAAVMAILVLPPLIADGQALARKSGLAELGLETAQGVWYIWFGSGSSLLVFTLAALAALGLTSMLRRNPLLQSACLGVILTLALVLVSQPQWVQHPLTMGRYLLPAIPLLLLASSCGAARVVGWFATRRVPGVLATLSLGAVAVVYVMTSPSWGLITRPNSQITHSMLQFDFRAGHNKVLDYQQQHLTVSAFWPRLSSFPADSLRIAVAPFYFESYNWDAPRWERSSGQRVFPAFLTGYCVKKRVGEVPQDTHYGFTNVFYLNQLTDRAVPGPDWLVYNRPFPGHSNGRDGQRLGANVQHCLTKLRKQLGAPDYQDELLLAWRLTR